MARPKTKRQYKLGNKTLTLHELDDVEVILPPELISQPTKATNGAKKQSFSSFLSKEKILDAITLELPDEETKALNESSLQLVEKSKNQAVRLSTENGDIQRRRIFVDDGQKFYVDTGSIVLKLHSHISDKERDTFLAQHQLKPMFDFGFARNMFIVELPDDHDVLAKTISLDQEDVVQYVEPNFLENMGGRFIPTDSNYNDQWQFHDTIISAMNHFEQKPGTHVNAESSWDYTRGDEMRVAVIDNRFDYTHNDLNIDTDYSAYVDGTTNNPTLNFNLAAFPAPADADQVRDSTHGTECAGMVAMDANNSAGGTGMANLSQLMLLAVKPNSLNFKVSAAIMVAYAANPSLYKPNAAPDSGVDIISCSLGYNGLGFGEKSDNDIPPSLRDAIEYASREGRNGRGTLIFWANDNAPSLISRDQVSSNPYAVSVSRSWWADKHHSAAMGPELDLVAPGVKVYTTGFDNTTPNIYTTVTGCSFATPLTAGIASLILSNKFQPNSSPPQLIKINQSLTGQEVKDILSRSALKVGLETPLSATGANDTPRNWVDKSDQLILGEGGVLNDISVNTDLDLPVMKDETILTVPDNSLFKVGQAVMVGARSILTGSGPIATGNNVALAVEDATHFPDTPNPIIIRTFDKTYLSFDTPLPRRAVGLDGLIVQDASGFKEKDEIQIDEGGNAYVREIKSIHNHGFMRLEEDFQVEKKWDKNVQVIRLKDKDGVSRIPDLTATGQKSNGTTITVDHIPASSAFPRKRTTIIEIPGTEVRVIRQILPDGKSLIIDPLENDHPIDTPVLGGRIPYRSDYYGRGRVDALEAIRAAINYNHDQRDLVIRKNMSDDGSGPTDATQQDIDSPDIWNRIKNPTDNAFNGDQAADPGDYNVAGPHESLKRSATNWLYARVRNRGNLYDALDFSVRFYVMLTDGTIPISKKDFQETRPERAVINSLNADLSLPAVAEYSIQDNTFGTFFLREKRFFNRQVDANYYYVAPANPGDPEPTDAIAPPPAHDPIKGEIWMREKEGNPMTPGEQTNPVPPADSDVRVAQVAWPDTLQPALPLGRTSTQKAAYPQGMPSSQLTKPYTTSQGPVLRVDNAHRYQKDQRLMIDLPGETNYAKIPVQKIEEGKVFLNQTPANDLAETTRITGLTDTRTHLTVAAGNTNTLTVQDASGLVEGQYILLEQNGYPTHTPANDGQDEVHRIKEISYTGGTHVLTLYDNLKVPANFVENSTAITGIQGQPKLYALVEITPHDGELAGDYVYDNNNLSYKELFLNHKISLLEDKGDNKERPLANSFQVDTDGSPLNVDFEIRIEDSENFDPKKVRIPVHLYRKNGSIESVYYYFNDDPASNKWEMSDGNQNWLSFPFNDPIVTGTPKPDLPAHPRPTFNNDPLKDLTIEGRLTLTNEYQKVRIAANIVEGSLTSVFSKDIEVVSVQGLPSGTSKDIQSQSGQAQLAGTQKVHCFADMTNLTQSQGQAFGPLDGNRFQLTAGFSSSNPAEDTMAYAGQDSLVLAQKNLADNTFNLILRPLRQAEINFTKVKYFIYRGIREEDIVIAGAPLEIRPTNNHHKANFIDHLQKVQNGRDPNTPLTLEMLNWDNKAGADLIDNYFFSADPAAQLPVVKRGMELGRFKTEGGNTIGFEIVLEDGDYPLKAAHVQSGNRILDISGTSESDLRKFQREEILHYLDPAAFYGMHYHSKVLYPVLPDTSPGTINTTNLKKNQIYDTIVKKFYTRNCLYIDIRNENGYSFNYYENHSQNELGIEGKSIKIGDLPPDSQPLNPDDYASQGWPIIIRNTQTAPSQTNTDYNAVYLQLPTTENHHPIVYLDYGYAVTPSTNNRFIEGNQLLDMLEVDSIEAGINIIVVRKNLSSLTDIGERLILTGNSTLEANKVYEKVNLTENPTNNNYTDIQVGTNTLPAAASTATSKGKVYAAKWTKPIGLAYRNITGEHASDRVAVSSMLKLRYFRNQTPQIANLTAISTASKQFTVQGLISKLIKVGDKILIAGTVSVGNQSSNGEYTIDSISEDTNTKKTTVTVEEAIPVAAGTIQGRLIMLNEKVPRMIHYSDQLFGPMTALSRYFPVVQLDAQSPSTSIIHIDGNHTQLINQNDTLSLFGSSSPGNNGRYGIGPVSYNEQEQKTEITIQTPQMLSEANDGQISLFYSVWVNEAPTRWISGFGKRYLDAVNLPVDATGQPLIGAAYVGETGIALEQNRVIFFMTPLDFFKTPKKKNRKSSSISINGGTSSEASFWQLMQKQNQHLRLNATLLQLDATTSVPVFDFKDDPGSKGVDLKKENFLALCVSRTELTQLKDLADISLTAVHSQNLVLRNTQSLTDQNGVKYLRAELKLSGLRKEADGELYVKEIGANSPIYVYALEADPMVFASKDAAEQEWLDAGGITYEENLRTQADAQAILALNANINTLTTDFENSLNGLNNDMTAIQSLVESKADQLWTEAVAAADASGSLPFDDRPLYWGRLAMSAALKGHTSLKKQRDRLNDMLKKLEDHSRGMSGIQFDQAAVQHNILLIAFDPYHLDKSIDPNYNIKQSNPSASIALNLHGKTIQASGSSAYIQSVILPVRYRELDQGMVEKLVLPYLHGDDKVDMIVSLNHNREGRIDIERFASKFRKPDFVDNANQKNHPLYYYQAILEGSDAQLKKISQNKRPEFLEGNLPKDDMIPGNNPQHLVMYNQAFDTDTVGMNYLDAIQGLDGTTDIAFPSTSAKARKGSTGAFIFNEVYYRIASVRTDLNSDTRIGHVSVSRIQKANQDFNVSDTQTLTGQVKVLLEDALAGLS